MTLNGIYNNDTQRIIIGIGGCGNELLNYILSTNYLKGRWVAVDTDAQTLIKSLSPKRIQIGEKETRGLGTNGDAELGRRLAEDAREKLAAAFENGRDVYILAGLNGGTGIGATPVLCSLAKATKQHTILFAVVNGSAPTKEEKSVLEKWRTFADEMQIWHEVEKNRFVVMGE